VRTFSIGAMKAIAEGRWFVAAGATMSLPEWSDVVKVLADREGSRGAE